MTIEQGTKLELDGFENKILDYRGAVQKIRECRERELKVILARSF